MNDQEAQLIHKRAELKRSIDEGMEKAFPAFLFNAMGRGLQKILRLQERPAWWVNAIVLFLLFIYIPGFLVAVSTGEIQRWRTFHWFYFGILPYGFFSSIVCYINVTYNLLPGIRDDIIDSILTIDELQELEKWLDNFWSIRKATFFSLLVGLLTAVTFTVILSLAYGSFVGFALTLLTFLVAPFFVGPVYVVLRTITFPTVLAKFRLRLYESDPINSEVIQQFISVMNIYLYWVAGYTAVGTALTSLNPITARLAWTTLATGWIPTIIQFLTIQYAVRKIAVTAKWQYLNRLQAQIKDIQNTNLIDASDAAITRLNKLMDLHDRISARPNSILTWGTGITFLNQLLLPLLGLFLGNLERLLKFFARDP